MHILVTGANGFIGRHLVEIAISAHGHSVTVLGRHPCGIPGVAEILSDDIASAPASKILERGQPDILINLVAAGVFPSDRDRNRLIDTNALLPARLVELAATAGIRGMISVGSCSEYSPIGAHVPIIESDLLETSKLYGSTKAAGGILALSSGATMGVSVAHVRLFNVYGPGEAAYRLFPSLTRSLRSGERPALSPGDQIRDFIHIEDVCQGLLQFSNALEKGSIESAAYNLSTGIGTTVRRFAELVASKMGKNPDLLAFGELPMRTDEVLYVVGDPTRTQRALSWSPAIRVDEGIERSLL